VFERYSEAARQSIVKAQEEARGLGHQSIGTEHLLLGVLNEPQGAPARALAGLGHGLDGVRVAVVAVLGRGPGETAGEMAFTRGAVATLGAALHEATDHGEDPLDPGHLLIGLLATADETTVRVLEELGLDAGQVRRDVAAAMRRPATGS
jgi:ATP-dependent Clp protease ATP-binding subunit ClpC